MDGPSSFLLSKKVREDVLHRDDMQELELRAMSAENLRTISDQKRKLLQ